MADRFSKEGIIRAKVDIEAGYVNDPDDLGGETNHGITVATAREFGYKGKMRDMTVAQALDIYDRGWWQRMKLDEIITIQPLLADRMFDFGINAGRANCIRSLQEILNVLNNQGKLYSDIGEDGGIGRLTLGSIASLKKVRGQAGMDRLMFALTCHQVAYYTEISQKRPKNEKFTYGWYDRVYREMATYAQYLNMI